MTPLSADERAELARLCEEATPGEWRAFHHEGYGWTVHSDQRSNLLSGDWNEADADFIAAARSALPRLLAQVDGLEAERDHYRKAYLDVMDALVRESSGPQDGVAEVRRLRRCEAEVERMRPVVEAAQAWAHHEFLGPSGVVDLDGDLRSAVWAYEEKP